MGAGLRIFGAAGPKARIRMVMERRPAGITIDTGPYPGFPTDLQSVFLAAEASGTGESQIRETVYEARFEAAVRLASFGADVSVHGDTAIIKDIRFFPELSRHRIFAAEQRFSSQLCRQADSAWSRTGDT